MGADGGTHRVEDGDCDGSRGARVALPVVGNGRKRVRAVIGGEGAPGHAPGRLPGRGEGPAVDREIDGDDSDVVVRVRAQRDGAADASAGRHAVQGGRR